MEPEAGSPIRRMPPLLREGSGTFAALLASQHRQAFRQPRPRKQRGARPAGRALLASADVAILPEDFDAAEVEKINPQCVAVTVSPLRQGWTAEGLEGTGNRASGAVGHDEQQWRIRARARYWRRRPRFVCCRRCGLYRHHGGAFCTLRRWQEGQAVSGRYRGNGRRHVFVPPTVLRHIYNGSIHRRNDQTIPAGQVKCRDGWVCIWIYNHRWHAVCTALDLPEMECDPRFADPAIRRRNWEAMFAIIQEKVADLAAEGRWWSGFSRRR